MPHGHHHGHDEDLEARVDTFLGEFRMVTPGIAALLGFQLMVAFSERFATVPAPARWLTFAGLCASALAFLFLLVPANYHRFTRRLEENDAFLQYARTSNAIAFVFIPIAVACSLGVQAMVTFGSVPAGAAVLVAFLVMAAFGWWLVPWQRATRLGEQDGAGDEPRQARLDERPARPSGAHGRPRQAQPSFVQRRGD